MFDSIGEGGWGNKPAHTRERSDSEGGEGCAHKPTRRRARADGNSRNVSFGYIRLIAAHSDSVCSDDWLLALLPRYRNKTVSKLTSLIPVSLAIRSPPVYMVCVMVKCGLNLLTKEDHGG